MLEPDAQLLLQALRSRKLTHRFDFDGAYPYTRMLKNQIKGKNNSWAVRLYASAFLKDNLTLYPRRNLVLNNSTDSSGAHYSTTSTFAGEIADSPIKADPISAEENVFSKQKIVKFHRILRSKILLRILRKLADMARRTR